MRVRPEAGLPAIVQTAPPAWWDDAVGDGIVASGAALGRVGLALPVLAPAQGFLLPPGGRRRVTTRVAGHGPRGEAAGDTLAAWPPTPPS